MFVAPPYPQIISQLPRAAFAKALQDISIGSTYALINADKHINPPQEQTLPPKKRNRQVYGHALPHIYSQKSELGGVKINNRIYLITKKRILI